MVSNWNLIRKDVLSHFISLKYLPRWVVLLVDVFAVFIAYTLAAFIGSQLKVDFQSGLLIEQPFVFPSLAFMFGQIFFFWLFHTYSGILRYSGFVDAAKLLLAVFVNVIVFLVVNLVATYAFEFKIYQYVTLLSYGVLAFFLLFTIRLIVKNTFDYLSTNTGKVTPVVIYGTKSAGISIAKMLRTNENASYKLIGFVDTDKEATSKVLMGVKVYKLTEQNVQKVISKKAKAVIVSPIKMEAINPKTDLDIFINNGMSVLVVPPMSQFGSDAAPTVQQIKSIEIEDLLERPQINISMENISNVINGKIVLITGAAGSIGSEIVKQSAKFNPKMIVLVDQAETPMHDLELRMKANAPNIRYSAYLGDVRNKERMEHMMVLYRPDIIFHAAAYKHVPLMEENPTESIQTNIKGTKIMADLAVKYNVSRFVMVSTDKAVNPTNVMGASKRIAEIYVQSLNNHIANGGGTTKFITTRFGNVLGSNGSVIPLFRKQIEKKIPVTVTHPEIIRYFMTIPEACLLVLEAGTTGSGGEIYIFDMGEPVKILDLAKKMIRLAGYKPDVDIPIVFTGLRPGEKLYEELLNNKEITQKTHHPKIMIATVREYDYLEVSEKINELIKFSSYGKNFLSVSQMKEIVPEFLSNNSLYERLDVEKELIN